MEFTVGMEVKTPLGLGTIKDMKNDGELILVEQTNGITTYLAEYPKDDLLPSVGHSDLYFAKVKPNAIIPTKRDEDAAYDLYACFEEEYMVIQPHETKLIPTGIATAFSQDYVAIIKERGSTGTKGIGQRCGVIDSGFRNEWFVPVTNHNEKPLVIYKETMKTEYLVDDVILYPYKKGIAQFMMVEVPKMNTYEISFKDLQKFESERGMGALGSSGK